MNVKKLKKSNETYELIEILQKEIDLIDKNNYPSLFVVPRHDISKKLKEINELMNKSAKEILSKELDKLKKEFKKL